MSSMARLAVLTNWLVELFLTWMLVLLPVMTTPLSELNDSTRIVSLAPSPLTESRWVIGSQMADTVIRRRSSRDSSGADCVATARTRRCEGRSTGVPVIDRRRNENRFMTRVLLLSSAIAVFPCTCVGGGWPAHVSGRVEPRR